MNATYNLTTDRISLIPDRRLTDGEYKQAKDARFQYWPGQKIFSAVWNTDAENFATSLAGDIEQDDTPDNLEARVNRFADYAEKSETEADRANAYATNDDPNASFRTHSPKRAEQAFARAVKFTEEAAYWQDRIVSAIHHAAMKDDPGVIQRRIKTLEADLRKWQRTEQDKTLRMKQGWYWDDWTKSCGLSYDTKWSQCTLEQQTDYQCYNAERLAKAVAHAQRWIDHISMRLAYEKAYLSEVGIPDLHIEVGGLVFTRGDWCRVTKINRSTVEVRGWWGLHKVDKTVIKQAVGMAEAIEKGINVTDPREGR